jgi:hypothetical protein
MACRCLSKRTYPKPKTVLRLPDLDQAKSAVLNSLGQTGEDPNWGSFSDHSSGIMIQGLIFVSGTIHSELRILLKCLLT